MKILSRRRRCRGTRRGECRTEVDSNGSTRIVVLIIVCLFVVACLVLLSVRLFRAKPLHDSQASVSQPIPASSPAVSLSQSQTGRSSSPAASSESADGPTVSAAVDRPRFAAADLPAPRKTAEKDRQLQMASASLRDYRSAFRENPVGDNAEITKRLLGKNSRSTRYLPADAHINSAGELTDRWEQPLFFHQISGTIMEIRSAGADHIMWTADDEIAR
ncbi:MAG: hypothetical protein JWO45_2152 [Spartobacteria bacterium]|nr:hypothetical protein [Spartobacteria bacterium]